MKLLFVVLLSALTGVLAQKHLSYDFLVPTLIILVLILFGVNFGEAYLEVKKERETHNKPKIWK